VAGWAGSHALKPGESLYGIARRYGITAAELQRANNITDPTRMRPGTVLRVPASGAAVASVAPPASPAPAAVETPPRKMAEAAPAMPPRAAPVTGADAPHIINAPAEPAPAVAPVEGTKVASRGDTLTDVTPIAAESPQSAGRSAAAGAMKFRWPVTGRIIAPYGKRPDGSSNDGINLAVPMGADVHAAEGGVVAYAGAEIKGFGNLLLIRHENGWVSAYAHNDQLLVRRGDTVKRGQVIAKAGKTGSVEQPQVHFELRQGSKPVDPLPHLDKG
jgi:murein DD-endopeptidase MepM/ murein hydrolase activator NlpD